MCKPCLGTSCHRIFLLETQSLQQRQAGSSRMYTKLRAVVQREAAEDSHRRQQQKHFVPAAQCCLKRESTAAAPSLLMVVTGVSSYVWKVCADSCQAMQTPMHPEQCLLHVSMHIMESHNAAQRESDRLKQDGFVCGQKRGRATE
eukprot:2234203-Rhodomonas_salina.1